MGKDIEIQKKNTIFVDILNLCNRNDEPQKANIIYC